MEIGKGNKGSSEVIMSSRSGIIVFTVAFALFSVGDTFAQSRLKFAQLEPIQDVRPAPRQSLIIENYYVDGGLRQRLKMAPAPRRTRSGLKALTLEAPKTALDVMGQFG
ncbi:MAG: hypothetical protein DCC75_12235, partial [Proteobacteria bacterium]